MVANKTQRVRQSWRLYVFWTIANYRRFYNVASSGN